MARKTGAMMLDEPTLWKWVFDHAWAGIAALMSVIWTMLNGRIKGVENRSAEMINGLATEHGRRIDHLTAEQNKSREIAAKIFDKLESMRTESAERHERLLIALHTGLAGKADK
jgi:hypothetical protein